MHKTQKSLSDIVIFNKYARYIPEEKRRENWNEIVDRYLTMMIKKYGTSADYAAYINLNPYQHEYSPLVKEILDNGKYLYSKDVLMSMRAAQFAGPAIDKNEARIYNCSYLPVDDYKAFSEIMFLLLGGTGVGYSVQRSDVNKLPIIQKPLVNSSITKYLIGDSIEGWADAIKALMKCYFGITRNRLRFDFSDIRPKGERLITAGGKAPGPEPLRTAIFKIKQILDNKNNGEKLTPLECHDIICHIADAVLAGGIRRAALISLFSVDDKEMRTCKHGSWWESNPQRGRANNSGVFVRGRATKEHFLEYWKQVKESNSGEPGIYWTNDPSYGTNPCCEISLRPFTFCNLTEINAGNLFETASQIILGEDVSGEFNTEENILTTGRLLFEERCKIAAFFGTLQAGFTDFHYLRPMWKEHTEKDALIGVGITGICNGDLIKLREKYPNILRNGAKIVKEENKRIAKIININEAARTTTVKPSGTTSCVVGTSSGIHAWHSKYYIRNMQCKIGSDIYNHFSRNHPDLIKDMDHQADSAVIGIPQKAPDIAILRENETALDMLHRVRDFNLEWVHEGHRRGPNTNNVSATVSIKDENIYLPVSFSLNAPCYGEDNRNLDDYKENEWKVVGDFMWETKDEYNGLSVLPYDGGTYADAPFQTCTEEEYFNKIQHLNSIDINTLKEDDDNTDLSGEVACQGGSCEIL